MDLILIMSVHVFPIPSHAALLHLPRAVTLGVSQSSLGQDGTSDCMVVSMNQHSKHIDWVGMHIQLIGKLKYLMLDVGFKLLQRRFLKVPNKQKETFIHIIKCHNASLLILLFHYTSCSGYL